jgi:CubicO group peptidase (beta-lactamase class C family)
MTTALAAQHPLWPPGSTHGYHAHTFGWLVGEVIRRITGRTPGTFFADEIATSLNLEAYIGLPPPTNTGSAGSSNPPPPFTPTRSHYAMPAPLPPRIDPNDPRVHAAEIPSSNGITTARALARFYPQARLTAAALILAGGITGLIGAEAAASPAKARAAASPSGSPGGPYDAALSY